MASSVPADRDTWVAAVTPSSTVASRRHGPHGGQHGLGHAREGPAGPPRQHAVDVRAASREPRTAPCARPPHKPRSHTLTEPRRVVATLNLPPPRRTHARRAVRPSASARPRATSRAKSSSARSTPRSRRGTTRRDPTRPTLPRARPRSARSPASSRRRAGGLARRSASPRATPTTCPAPASTTRPRPTATRSPRGTDRGRASASAARVHTCRHTHTRADSNAPTDTNDSASRRAAPARPRWRHEAASRPPTRPPALRQPTRPATSHDAHTHTPAHTPTRLRLPRLSSLRRQRGTS